MNHLRQEHIFESARHHNVTPTCTICETPIKGVSVDLIMCTTVYDPNDGEVIKTMEPAPPECDDDYVVICEGCKPGVVNHWNYMLYLLRSKGA